MNNLTLNYIKTTHNNPVEKGYHWVESWLFSTNAKQIGILYGIFALFSGLVGLSISILMRIELASPNPQILMHNGQLWNVLITAHAVFMVFFLVMPVTMGAFGNKQKNESFYINENNYNILSKSQLGSYLAGLIEGDGTITVHNDISKNRYSPFISIVFTPEDEEQIKFLINNIEHYYNVKIGIINTNNKTYLLWQISKIEDIYIMISLIKNYFRTPKIIKLYEAINWINKYIIENNIKLKNMNIEYGYNNINYNKINNILNKIDFIDLIELDNSSLDYNAWLSGFTDADGNFMINIANRKHRSTSVNLSFNLEIQQNLTNYIKNNKLNIINENIVKLNIINKYNSYDQVYINLSFNCIMSKIAEFYNSNLYSRTRNLKLKNQSDSKLYYSYIVKITSLNNLLKVKNYYINNKLLSTKRNNFDDWIEVLDCINKHNSRINIECIELAKKIQLNYNKMRKSYNYNHLYKK